jgi:hypothetical protein
MSARLPILLAGGALAIAALVPARAGAAPGGWRLPDLEQEAPSGLVLTNGAAPGAPARYYLGFRSAVRNVGSGPLIIRGRRASRRTPTMRATQLIRGEGGELRRVRDVGRMRYVVSPGHRHWHLLTFDRYTLRGAAGGPRVARREHPGRLTMREGISVGYGDDYAANLEGQLIELTGLPDGRYVLTHEVNPDRRLRELRDDNNAASLSLSVRWLRGLPSVRVLAVCEHSADCTEVDASRASASRRPPAVPVAPETQRRFYCHVAAALPAAG